MKIRFIGPLGKVTGSMCWLQDKSRDWSFLIDCGMQQGENTVPDWNSCGDWPFDPAELNFVVLTHAHIDHSGLIPALYKRGFRGKVYCTEETKLLAQKLLQDAARFSGAPYSLVEISAINWNTPGKQTQFGGYHPVAQDLFIRFHRTGHIIGAVSVTVLWGAKGPEQRSIVFSGDIGPGSEDLEIAPFLRYPQHPKPADFAVLESTYGDTIRTSDERDPQVRRARLGQLIDRVVESRGTLAIPAFSVGRTQDLLFDIHYLVAKSPDKYRHVEFILDAPTAVQVNAITLDALKKCSVSNNQKVRPLWLGKQLFRDLGLDLHSGSHVKFAGEICEATLRLDSPYQGGQSHGNAIARNWRSLFKKAGDRSVLLATESGQPRVVIMGSGTCDGGAATIWLPRLLQSQQNVVAISGYCAATTIGGQLLSLMSIPTDQKKLHTGTLNWHQPDGSAVDQLPINQVKATISRLGGYSAHGDQRDLVNWLFESHKGEIQQSIAHTVFLQHGEDRCRAGLKKAIQARAEEWKLEVAVLKPDDSDQWYDLEKEATEFQLETKLAEWRKLAEKMERLQQETERLQQDLAVC